MKPLLSVVVPVYNVENYIEKSIRSIVNQTYPNMQIILVDDGSIDHSGELCDQFELQYENVEVIHQSNKGSAAARQCGALVAKGEYIIWVDPDDWIESDYFEMMMNKAIGYDVDLVAADLYMEIDGNVTVVANQIPEGIYDSEEIINSMLYSGVFYEYGIRPNGVTKLFKNDIHKKVQTQMDTRIVVGDDAAVVYPYILLCDKVMVTDICGYHYVQRSDSITKKKSKTEIHQISILVEYLKEKFHEYPQVLNQLDVYQKYLIASRDLSYWDNEMILLPYGGIELSAPIVIYGAGGMGQTLYEYCRFHQIPVKLWVDRCAEHYQQEGLPVISFDEFKVNEEKWEYILIANTNEHTAKAIKRDLLAIPVVVDKIKWFSEEFIGRT